MSSSALSVIKIPCNESVSKLIYLPSWSGIWSVRQLIFDTNHRSKRWCPHVLSDSCEFLLRETEIVSRRFGGLSWGWKLNCVTNVEIIVWCDNIGGEMTDDRWGRGGHETIGGPPAMVSSQPPPGLNIRLWRLPSVLFIYCTPWALWAGSWDPFHRFPDPEP